MDLARVFCRLLATIALAVVAVCFVSGSKAEATPLPVVHVSGTLQTSQTWNAGTVYVVNNTLTIPQDVTLTINPGAIVKYVTMWWNQGIVVSGGTLYAQGSSSQSIYFTSLEDDSLGGDSAGDGLTTGASGDYSTAVTNNGGLVVVQYSEIRYGGESLFVSCNSGGMTTVNDAILRSTVRFYNCGQGAATLQRNQFYVQ